MLSDSHKMVIATDSESRVFRIAFDQIVETFIKTVQRRKSQEPTFPKNIANYKDSSKEKSVNDSQDITNYDVALLRSGVTSSKNVTYKDASSNVTFQDFTSPTSVTTTNDFTSPTGVTATNDLSCVGITCAEDDVTDSGDIYSQSDDTGSTKILYDGSPYQSLTAFDIHPKG